MIKIGASSKIKEVSNKKENHSKNNKQDKQRNLQAPISIIRPEVVDAKVYKLKSAFVKNSVFVTLSYIIEDEKIRPVEIFINSKDLSRSHEYVILTRLISAVFRRGSDVMFILEELQGILDPEGGRFKEGNYYHSLYAEIAEVIQNFFYDVGILKTPEENTIPNDGVVEKQDNSYNENFKICPTCNSKTLKVENGCDVCVQCGYSKCDK